MSTNDQQPDTVRVSERAIVDGVTALAAALRPAGRGLLLQRIGDVALAEVLDDLPEALNKRWAFMALLDYTQECTLDASAREEARRTSDADSEPWEPPTLRADVLRWETDPAWRQLVQAASDEMDVLKHLPEGSDTGDRWQRALEGLLTL